MRTTMRFISILLFLFSSLLIQAQTKLLNFDTKGNFKIIQFTDVHYQKNNKESAVAIQLINEVLDAEKPDLVVFTGDIVFAKPVKEGLDDVFAPAIKRQIPWAYVFGNHDDEFEVSRQEILDHVIQKPYCMVQSGDKSVGGVGNYILEVKDRNKDKNSTVLYFFDSRSYSLLDSVKGYGWFTFNQIEWYRNQSAAYTKQNGGKPYPSLAFFHIPLAEYPLMTSAKDAKIIGEKREDECNGKLNSGMFTAMREAGDVMGTFVGHDHDNDYIGNYYDIYLAYGRFSGGKTVYNNLGKNGCRVIELKEGQRVFSTSVRLLGGEKLYSVEYPTTFLAK